MVKNLRADSILVIYVRYISSNFVILKNRRSWYRSGCIPTTSSKYKPTSIHACRRFCQHGEKGRHSHGTLKNRGKLLFFVFIATFCRTPLQKGFRMRYSLKHIKIEGSFYLKVLEPLF